MVVGIAIGAFVSMKMSGAKRQPISPIWARALGSPSPALRYAVAFGAGFLMLIGARIADGCTSGHGLSGLAQLSVGFDDRRHRDVRRRHRHRHAGAASHLTWEEFACPSRLPSRPDC